MADITDILQSITQSVSGLEGVNRALDEFNKLKKDALRAGDGKAILELEKLEKASKKYIRSQEELVKLQDEIQESYKKTGEASQEQLSKLKKLTAESVHSERIIMEVKKRAVRQVNEQTRAVKEYNEAVRDSYKQNTLLGKGLSILGSGFTKVTGAIVGGSLAFQAWQRYSEAASLRQEILIQRFQGFSEVTHTATGETKGYVGAAIDAIAANSKFSSALKDVQSAAILVGQDAGSATQLMAEFSRVSGSKAPKDLARLSKATLTVATSMGLTLPDAMDYVKVRMDKFGGTAASAIVSLNNIKIEAEQVNKMFGRTVVRADDVAKSLLEISRSTTVYAIDQRFVSGILRENIARLQATGDSYELARRKAEAFTKGVTGDAPDWMKALAGEDLTNQMFASLRQGPEQFMKEFGDALDAAAPGLADQVKDILEDSSIDFYEKTRLLQEMTAGSEVGISAMNKQLIKLAETSQGIEVIAQQFGVSRVEAHGMVEQAKEFEARQTKINKLVKATPAELAKALKISKEQAKNLLELNKTEKDRKREIRERLKVQDEIDAAEASKARIKAKAERAKKTEEIVNVVITGQKEQLAKIEEKIETTKADIAEQTKNLENARKKGDKDAEKKTKTALEAAEKQLKEAEANKIATKSVIRMQQERLEQAKDAQSEDEKSKQTIEQISSKQLDAFEKLKIGSEDHFASMVKYFSSLEGVLAIGFASVVTTLLSKAFLGRMARKWARNDTSMGSKLMKFLTDTPQGGKGGKGGRDGGGKAPTDKGGGGLSKSTTPDEKARRKALKDQTRIEQLKAKGDEESLKRAQKLQAKQEKAAKLPVKEKGGKLVKAFETKDTAGKTDALKKVDAPDTPQPPKPDKKGFFAGLMDRAKSAKENVDKMFSGKGIMGTIGKFIKPVGKVFLKFAGVVGGIISTLTDLPGILTAMWENNWGEALARMAPMIAGGIGTLLGSLGGPVGTALGGVAGAALGEKIKNMYLESQTKTDTEKKTDDPKPAKEPKKSEAKEDKNTEKMTGILQKQNKLIEKANAQKEKQEAFDQSQLLNSMVTEGNKTALAAVKATVPPPKKVVGMLSDNLKEFEKQTATKVGDAVKTAFQGKKLKFENLQASTVNITQGIPVEDVQKLAASQTQTQQQIAAAGGVENVVDLGATSANQAAAAVAATAPGPAQAVGNLGPMNPDGSITLTIQNFGRTVGNAQLMMNRRQRQPGVV